jgi:hypothetical protein
MRSTISGYRRSAMATMFCVACCSLSYGPALGQTPSFAAAETFDGLAYSNNYHVVELRRYTIKSGQRERFARYFDTWFPEAFQQLGSLAVGQFLERDHADGFTWIRVFKSMGDFAIVKSAFYYGPVWQEHKKTLNDMIVDSDNVLLLTPLDPARGIAALAAPDPTIDSNTNRGVALAQIFRAKPESLNELTRRAKSAFGKYRAAGAREAALLVTLNTTNTYPLHPIRTDGPFLVWIGVVSDDVSARARVTDEMERAAHTLAESSLLQAAPETIVMAPTQRSRLRWVPD